jgi:hypothetical protein
MTALIETLNKSQTRQLIFEAKGGILTNEESNTLEQYLTFSQRLYIGAVDGKLVCAWGLIPPSLLSDQAYLWLFSTEAVEEYKFLFVRNSQKAVQEMLKEYSVITGFCEIGNDRSIRWLRWLGAKFGEPVNAKMVPFEIRKRNG